MVDERRAGRAADLVRDLAPEELVAAAGFVKGWLESREIEVRSTTTTGCPVLVAEVGSTRRRGADASSCTAISTSCPGRPEQFEPRVDGDRLIGRGAYDMKGGLAAMMCAVKDVARQERVRVRLVCVPDEESEEIDERSTDAIVARGLGGDFAITGEPTDLHIGIEAKGVLAMRIVVHGRAAHSSTPWLGDNAVLKAIDVFRAIETLPFSRESSEMFDRPSINLGRIEGGDALNKVPDECTMAVDVRYLPGQDPAAILEQVRGIPDIEVDANVHPPDRGGVPAQSLRACAARRGRALDERRGDERRPRRCLGRRVVHRGGDPGGRVRARLAAAITARRVGLAVLARALPPRARRLRPGAAARGSRAPGARLDGLRASRGEAAGVRLLSRSRAGALWRFALAGVAGRRRGGRDDGRGRAAAGEARSSHDIT